MAIFAMENKSLGPGRSTRFREVRKYVIFSLPGAARTTAARAPRSSPRRSAARGLDLVGVEGQEGSQQPRRAREGREREQREEHWRREQQHRPPGGDGHERMTAEEEVLKQRPQLLVGLQDC